ncbi:hypothetical protein JCM5296_003265 [Sporobolomyces johnsonii]
MSSSSSSGIIRPTFFPDERSSPGDAGRADMAEGEEGRAVEWSSAGGPTGMNQRVDEGGKGKGRAAEASSSGGRTDDQAAGLGIGGSGQGREMSEEALRPLSGPGQRSHPTMSPSTLRVALDDLLTSSPQPTPRPPTSPNGLYTPQEPPQSASGVSSGVSAPFPSTSHPNGRRRPRLFSLGRSSPSHSRTGLLSPQSELDTAPSGAERRGDNAERKHRSLSSLSLASLKAASRRNSAPDPTVDGAATTPSSPISDKFNGKGKLRRLLRLAPASGTFAKLRPLEPRPAFSSVYATPPASPHRSSSRGRSHSAPLLLAHASPFAATAATTPFFTPQTTQGELDHVGSETSSLAGSRFCTAVSSPVSISFPPSPDLAAEAVAAPPPDLFAYYLPYELQLRVMKALLDVHEEDWRREVRARRWKGERARERWNDGKGRGRKDLVRLGRVSQACRQLSLDGQLWETAPASSLIGADALSSEAVLSLMDQSGAYVKTLDAKGMYTSLDWKTLERVVEGARAFQLEGSTNFTTIDLAGCASLTASSITSLLSHSPHLTSLSLFALRMVNSSHMTTLGSTCPRLVSLNVSRCPDVPAPSLLALPYPPKPSSPTGSTATMSSGRGLKVLKAAYLPGMDDETLVALFERHEELEVLDVSFSSQLTDGGFHRITTPPAPAPAAALDGSSARSPTRRRWIRPSQTPSPLITTSSVPPPAPATPEQRIFSNMRHLDLSGCSGLTSLALSHLAGSLPSLEILELSRLTASLRVDEHVARLLLSCPKLRRLDLEDASELGDEVLRALLPATDDDTSPLEHLVINGCATFSDLAISDVVHACTNLRILEADGTAVTDRTSREFVNLSRPRLLVAQASAAERAPHDPLAKVQTPGVLSILDNRLTGRRLSREVGTLIRPRTGQRGWWTRAVGFYHDEDDDDAVEGENNYRGGGGGRDRSWKATHLFECDTERIVVRSFYSSLAVDAANALREAKEGGGAASGALRGRALSDSVVRRGWGDDEDEAGSVGCVVS